MNSTDFLGYVFFAPTLPVPLAYGFKLHKRLLVNGKGARVTRSLCLVSALVGFLLIIVRPGINDPIVNGALLFVPLAQFMFFGFIWKLFLKTYHREPRDTFGLNPESMEASDVAFNFGFFVISFSLSMILVALLTVFGY